MNPFSDLPWLFWERLENERYLSAAMRRAAVMDAAKPREVKSC